MTAGQLSYLRRKSLRTQQPLHLNMVVMIAFTVAYQARGASILTWIPPTYSERRRDLRAMCSQDSLSRRSFSMQVVANSRVHERRPHFLRQKLFSRAYQSRATAAEQASLSAKKLKLQHRALAFPWLVQQPLKRAASAAGVALAMWISLQAKPGASFLQGLVRSEACLSGAILVVAPVLLRSWAKLEAGYHDTLECRTVLQTYLIAASGGLCATLAAIAGHPISATLLQVIWRGVAARALWTWVDLGKNLRDTPGWLHASVARWRIAATYVAVVGSVARFLILVVRMSSLQAMATALSSPMVDFLPAWFITAASTPDAEFRLNAAELALGVSLYAWIAYYLCVFLPYRMIFTEYQDYGRRLSQFWKDLENGQEHNVIFSTKLGPGFPKHLSKRIAKMPAGNDRELLRLAGVIRQRSCSQTIVKAAMLKKNKEGKYGIKMTPIEPGDLTYWGSDLFKRLEQQEKRDKETGWTPPIAPGKGRFKHIKATYARILREVKVELGKTDVEMASDPLLSLSNLMRFDPDAEEGDFDLVVQKQGSLDVSADTMLMKPGGHEMVMMTDEAPEDLDDLYGDRGLPLQFGGVAVEDAEGRDSGLHAEDPLGYNRDDPAVSVLEETIRSTKSTKE